MPEKPAPKFKINLNLLYPQGVPLKLPVQLIKWALSGGRYLGIAVEILVLIAFAARFKLDSDLVNLKEQINQQVPFINSLTSQAQIIRETQFKLSVVKNAYSSSLNWAAILKDLSSQTPPGVIYNSLTFNKPEGTQTLEFKISGQASSNSDMAVFLNGLKNHEKFQNVLLSSISFDSAGLNFTITGNLK